MKPASAKAKGSKFERDIALVLGGKRTPLSGATGGGDITLPTGSIWSDWSFEAKARKKLPALITAAMAQASADIALGDRRSPAVIIREDRGRALFVADLQDLVSWAEALAEVGNASKVRALGRQLEGSRES